MKAYKDDINTRVAILETVAAQVNQILIRLEKINDEGFEKIDKRFNKIDDKFEKFEEKLLEIKKENSNHFRTTIITLLTLIGSPLFVKSVELLTSFFNR